MGGTKLKVDWRKMSNVDEGQSGRADCSRNTPHATWTQKSVEARELLDVRETSLYY